MSIIDYEDRIVEIVQREDHSDFLYDLLDVYDTPRATITRLKNGNLNLAKRAGEVHLKNKVWFKEVGKGNIFDGFVDIEQQVAELSAKPRYLIVTDFDGILVKDTKTQEALDIKFEQLPQHFSFFLAWKGIEKVDFEKESHADIKAAGRFARIYDIVKKENNLIDTKNGIDIFFMRLLFCLFAEDTGIFKRGSFTNAIKTLTRTDGSDLNKFFTDLFVVLDTKERVDVPSYLQEFPYVNGQLFSEPHKELTFSAKSRKLIIDSGELLNWAKINPDIFGSMIQAIATDESRSHLGMHYTSVPNIMKVIKPLFLDDLNKAFEQAYDSVEKLDILYDRIGKIKFFDPACGSGNFLIITYKELRRLEIKILLRKRELTENLMYLPSVTLGQFYGIEVDEFAHDVAKLSLWIAEHQMNIELEEIFGDKVRATLPLQSAGDIRCANAIKVDWLDVCPVQESEEVYVFGNPPYLGSKKQNKEHKADMLTIFKNVKNGKMLDYISAWFFLGAKYSQTTNAKVAFVSTNSITHGEQVFTLWNQLFKFNIEINFAYTSFKWSNNAIGNAGVTVVIIGFGPINSKKNKYLFIDGTKKLVSNISPYLTDGENILVSTKSKPISNLPRLRFGNMPNDGGGLLFTITEYADAINQYPQLVPYFKKFIGSDEFINGGLRYCLWLNKEKYEEIKSIPLVQKRISITKQHREKSKDKGTNKLALTPWKFRDTHEANKYSIVIPAVSSENRFYIPMGLVGADTVLSNRVYAIYDADIYLLGILMSRMHMTWVKAVGGRLETRYNYSAGLCYNTFPLPELSTTRKNRIIEVVLKIIDIREEMGGTLAELYNPLTMPLDLKEAHEELDGIVDRAYRQRGFENDEERLSLLLNMYQEMTGE
ncbi:MULTISPECIES: class I SAM-dependent DNA methyltransferase [Bacillaceae]|uniref:site-specific DNA-methyltransferase (adenine-specific) n=1 Tax=Bacillus norwichensis TaxID=2762217 RepID=A0ABR8VQT5_9BACI|nr:MULTISPECIES: class I SAM-dependent DNA methyltransferase [Bacillaceae]MBD8007098.1 class I SAM-dependent DNA methyltransferase [Bacillus norwichensis]